MASSPLVVAETTTTGYLNPSSAAVTEVDFRPSLHQALVMAGIVAFTAAVSLVGLGALARPLYVVLAIAAAAFYHRRSPWLYLTLTLWFWTISPFVRRIIDFSAGYEQINIVLVAPNITCLFMLKDILTSRDLQRRPEALLGLMLVVPALYGLIVNLVQGQIFPGAIAASDWMAPLLYFFFIVDKAPSVKDAEPYLRWFITLNGLVVVGYGLNQVWNMPAWDSQWVRLSGIFGTTELSPLQTFHPFSTLNISGLLAEWLGALILLSLYFRTPLTTIVLPAACLLLIMTFVRSVTVGVMLGASVATLLGGRHMVTVLGRILIALVLVSVIAASLDPAMVDDLNVRFSSLEHLENDDSALTRNAIWAGAPAIIDAHPFGMGIGALGRGAVSQGNADLVTVDAGPLAIYLSLGWIAGTIYLFGMLAAVGLALVNAARLQSPPVVAFAAAALCSVLELLFVNINGFGGAVLWVSAAFAVAYGIQNRINPGENLGTI